MQWKRILDAARRNGIPLIVADQNGSEPMVVLSLEQFEAMSSAPRKQNVPENAINTSNVSEPVLESLETPGNSEDLSSKNPIKMGEDAPLEENFFLEPLEDSESSKSL